MNLSQKETKFMWEKELQAAIEAAQLVVPKILEVYHSTDFGIEIKGDNSPVTIADKMADNMIREYLSKIYPTYAFLTEESEDDLSRLENDLVWIVDPIDGTKDFIAKDNEFCTSIGLAYKGEIVVGVISAPALGELFYASKGQGAYKLKDGVKTKLHVSDKTSDLTYFASVFHEKEPEINAVAKHSDVIKRKIKVGSALKACRIAEGKGELFYRLGPGSKEWDVAAMDIIMVESGGVFCEPDGSKIVYNRKDVYQRKGYIAANKKENILL